LLEERSVLLVGKRRAGIMHALHLERSVFFLDRKIVIPVNRISAFHIERRCVLHVERISAALIIERKSSLLVEKSALLEERSALLVKKSS